MRSVMIASAASVCVSVCVCLETLEYRAMAPNSIMVLDMNPLGTFWALGRSCRCRVGTRVKDCWCRVWIADCGLAYRGRFGATAPPPI